MQIISMEAFMARVSCARCRGRGVIAGSTAGPQRVCDACNGSGKFSFTPGHELITPTEPTP